LERNSSPKSRSICTNTGKLTNIKRERVKRMTRLRSDRLNHLAYGKEFPTEAQKEARLKHLQDLNRVNTREQWAKLSPEEQRIKVAEL